MVSLKKNIIEKKVKGDRNQKGILKINLGLGQETGLKVKVEENTEVNLLFDILQILT